MSTSPSLNSVNRFLTAQALSLFGSAFTDFALPLFVYHQTKSAFLMGAIWGVAALSKFLSGLWISKIGKGRSDRGMLTFTQCCLGLGILIPVMAPISLLVPAVLVSTVLQGFFQTLLSGATQSLIFNVAQQHAAAANMTPTVMINWINTRIESFRNTGLLGGYLAAWFLSAKLGFTACLIVDSLTFFVAAILIGTIKESGHISESTPVKIGYRLLLENKVRLLTFSQLTAGMALYAYNGSYVVTLKRDLGAGDFWVFVLMTTQFATSTLTNWSVQKWTRNRQQTLGWNWIVRSRFIMALAAIGFLMASTAPIFIVANIVLTAAVAIGIPLVTTQYQKAFGPSEQREVGAARFASVSIAGALGAAIAGWLMSIPEVGHVINFSGMAVLFGLAAVMAQIHLSRTLNSVEK